MYKGKHCQVEKRQQDSYRYGDAFTLITMNGLHMRKHLEKEIAANEAKAAELREALETLDKDMAPKRGPKPKKVALGTSGVKKDDAKTKRAAF